MVRKQGGGADVAMGRSQVQGPRSAQNPTDRPSCWPALVHHISAVPSRYHLSIRDLLSPYPGQSFKSSPPEAHENVPECDRRRTTRRDERFPQLPPSRADSASADTRRRRFAPSPPPKCGSPINPGKGWNDWGERSDVTVAFSSFWLPVRLGPLTPCRRKEGGPNEKSPGQLVSS